MGSRKMVISGTLVGGMVLGMMLVLISAGFSYGKVEGAGAEQPAKRVKVEGGAESVLEAECSISEKYPQKVRRWCGLVMKYGEKYEVPVNLIAAVMLQESGGNPKAYSTSGAVGLMQVMPRDGKAREYQCVNGPCFAGRPRMEELEEPEFNVRYGVKMLKQLKKREGNWREALRAYGPGDAGYSYADKVLRIYKQYQ